MAAAFDPLLAAVGHRTEAASAVTPEFAQRLAQRAGDETVQNRASRCGASDLNRAQTKPPKSRPVADLSGVVRPDATAGTSSGGGTRTPDTRIMIPFSPFMALP